MLSEAFIDACNALINAWDEGHYIEAGEMKSVAFIKEFETVMNIIERNENNGFRSRTVGTQET